MSNTNPLTTNVASRNIIIPIKVMPDKDNHSESIQSTLPLELYQSNSYPPDNPSSDYLDSWVREVNKARASWCQENT